MVGLNEGLVRSTLFICIWISARQSLPFYSLRTLHQCFFATNQHRRPKDNFHLFFEWKPADQLWKKITPLLKLLTKRNSRNINRTKILFNSFPPGMGNNVKKLVLSIFQIIFYKLWINRNYFKKRLSSRPRY